MLNIKNLSKTRSAVRTLDGVNLTLSERGIVFLLGETDSGNFALLNILSGLDTHDMGEIVIDGHSSLEFYARGFDNFLKTLVVPAFSKNTQNTDLRVTSFDHRAADPVVYTYSDPTDTLDSVAIKPIFDKLKQLAKTKLVLVASNDPDLAQIYGNRVVTFEEGRIISDVSKQWIPSKSTTPTKPVAPTTKPKQSEQTNPTPATKAANKVAADKAATSQTATATNNNADKTATDKTAGIYPYQNKYTSPAEGGGIIPPVYKDSTALTQNESAAPIPQGEVKPLETKKEYTLKNSKLTYKDSLKLGFSAMFTRFGRLFFTIVFTFLALSLFGIADVFGSYDKYEDAKAVMDDIGVEFTAVSAERQDGYYGFLDNPLFLKSYMTVSDVQYIQDENPNLTFYPVYDIDHHSYGGHDLSYYNTADSLKDETEYYKTKIYGLVELSEIELANFGFTYEGILPKAADEIAISKYTYELFTKAGYRLYEQTNTYLGSTSNPRFEINSVSDILGRRLVDPRDTDHTFKITAVIDTKVSPRYDKLKGESTAASAYNQTLYIQEFNRYISSSFHSLFFIGPNFFDNTGYIESPYDPDIDPNEISEGPYTFAITSLKDASDDAIEQFLVFTNSDMDGKADVHYRMLNAASNHLYAVSSTAEVAHPILLLGSVILIFIALLICLRFMSKAIYQKRFTVVNLFRDNVQLIEVLSIFIHAMLILFLVCFALSLTAQSITVTIINNHYNGALSPYSFGIRQAGITFGVGMLLTVLSIVFATLKLLSVKSKVQAAKNKKST